MSKSQKSLLILEDVWSPEVAKAFSACRNVIITSRNAAIASEVQTRIVHNISVSEGEGWLEYNNFFLHIITLSRLYPIGMVR